MTPSNPAMLIADGRTPAQASATAATSATAAEQARAEEPVTVAERASLIVKAPVTEVEQGREPVAAIAEAQANSVVAAEVEAAPGIGAAHFKVSIAAAAPLRAPANAAARAEGAQGAEEAVADPVVAGEAVEAVGDAGKAEAS